MFSVPLWPARNPFVHRTFGVPGNFVAPAFPLQPEQLAAYDNEGQAFVEPGQFVISVGGGQPGDRAAPSAAISTELTVR